MFKKLLQSLSRSQSATPSGPLPARKSGPLTPPAKPSGILGRIVKGEGLSAPVPSTPEHLCEITPKMSRDEISARLKLLYRRYNRSASSLDGQIRAEADKMLDAIVAVREKHFGAI